MNLKRLFKKVREIFTMSGVQGSNFKAERSKVHLGGFNPQGERSMFPASTGQVFITGVNLVSFFCSLFSFFAFHLCRP